MDAVVAELDKAYHNLQCDLNSKMEKFDKRPTVPPREKDVFGIKSTEGTKYGSLAGGNRKEFRRTTKSQNSIIAKILEERDKLSSTLKDY